MIRNKVLTDSTELYSEIIIKNIYSQMFRTNFISFIALFKYKTQFLLT